MPLSPHSLSKAEVDPILAAPAAFCQRARSSSPAHRAPLRQARAWIIYIHTAAPKWRQAVAHLSDRDVPVVLQRRVDHCDQLRRCELPALHARQALLLLPLLRPVITPVRGGGGGAARLAYGSQSCLGARLAHGLAIGLAAVQSVAVQQLLDLCERPRQSWSCVTTRGHIIQRYTCYAHIHAPARTHTHAHTHTHLLLAAPFARQLASFTRLRVSQHRGVPQSMEAQVRQRTSPARDEPSQTTTDECLSDWPEPFSTPKRIEGTHRAVAVGFQRADTRPRRWPWRRR
jgi:hypothetical protein